MREWARAGYNPDELSILFWHKMRLSTIFIGIHVCVLISMLDIMYADVPMRPTGIILRFFAPTAMIVINIWDIISAHRLKSLTKVDVT